MKNLLRVLSIIVTLIATIFVGMGFYKINVYGGDLYKNMYVKQDGTNLIINGTYFDGYVSLGGSLYVVASVLFAGSCLLSCDNDENFKAKTKRRKKVKSKYDKSNDLLKLKELLDSNAITQEEFENEKKKY